MSEINERYRLIIDGEVGDSGYTHDPTIYKAILEQLGAVAADVSNNEKWGVRRYELKERGAVVQCIVRHEGLYLDDEQTIDFSVQSTGRIPPRIAEILSQYDFKPVESN